MDAPKRLDKHVETLLFSIYFSAVSTCTAKECTETFGESRVALMRLYGKTIEAKLSDNYSLPSLESVQALVMYLTAVRRDDNGISVRALFSLAVRMAQMITLDEDPAERYSPFEAELRRRLWWHLCGLESRAAEEGVARHTSIMENRQVRIPSNLNDVDLQPDMKQPVAPRKGVAETSFVILRFEVYSLAHNLWATKKKFQLAGRSDDAKGVQEEQRAALETFKSDQRRDLISFCDTSRRLDWLVTTLYEAMCIKMHTIITHPTTTTTPIPTAQMSPASRLGLLHSSVTLIAYTLGLSRSERLGDWAWCFRGYVQWHAVAVVIAELGRSTNVGFAERGWEVLDPVLRSWDRGV